jgi:hypothetical protein
MGRLRQMTIGLLAVFVLAIAAVAVILGSQAPAGARALTPASQAQPDWQVCKTV